MTLGLTNPPTRPLAAAGSMVEAMSVIGLIDIFVAVIALIAAAGIIIALRSRESPGVRSDLPSAPSPSTCRARGE